MDLRAHRISAYLALAGFWCAVLSVFVAVFADMAENMRRFTESAASIHGQLSAEAHRHREAVRNLAAFMEIEYGAGRDNVSSYAGRIMGENSHILLLGLVREVLRSPVPEIAAVSDSGLIGIAPEPDTAIRLRILAEAESTRRVLSPGFSSSSALKYLVQRARMAQGTVAGPVSFREGWGRVRLLMQRVADGGGESFVLAVCKLPGVPAGDRERLSVTLHESDRGSEGAATVLLRSAVPKPGPIATAVFPALRFRSGLDGPSSAPVVEIERYLDWDSLDRELLGALFGVAGLFLGAFAAHDRAIRRLAQRTLDEGNRLFRMANFEALTGLPNRQLFHNRLDRALAEARRTGQQHALLYLDLDGFKQINDFFGHEIGDKVLQRAARIFLNRVREADTVARLGGDEFVILLTGVASRRAAELVADKIKSAFSRSPSGTDAINRALPVLGTSVGIAVYPDDGETAEELLRVADRSMYRDKADGKGQPRPMTLAG
jgi:diguanylate cyclase (GGDEF)-like protein